jgi:ubiquitin carboxyl-terminal hydrolase 7
VHRGTVEAGHYYAYVRPGLDDKWYEFNDANVRRVSKHRAFGDGVGGK